MQSVTSHLASTARALARLAADGVRIVRARRTKFRAALAHNRVHTFRHVEQPSWMCPKCNRVHNSLGREPFIGPIYPACCGFKAGSRLESHYATGSRR
ncbi:hypothetical protein [Piscinibacter gummiphilus]|uniref:Transposase n=1 Tax=Piscinibacter gummiphilus TaxID=946333 RepID=A0ABZ0CTU8_9BURK|nr:hypothetical protein [Piscinibacter gummiphilus]WOB06536.1 hypothetical protein RXV79_16575 [Piscinibacter gummiphilus]